MSRCIVCLPHPKLSVSTYTMFGCAGDGAPAPKQVTAAIKNSIQRIHFEFKFFSYFFYWFLVIHIHIPQRKMPFPTNELSGSERKSIGINGNTVVTFLSKGLGHPVRYVVSYEIKKDVG